MVGFETEPDADIAAEAVGEGTVVTAVEETEESAAAVAVGGRTSAVGSGSEETAGVGPAEVPPNKYHPVGTAASAAITSTTGVKALEFRFSGS